MAHWTDYIEELFVTIPRYKQAIRISFKYKDVIEEFFYDILESRARKRSQLNTTCNENDLGDLRKFVQWTSSVWFSVITLFW